jgi:hypothetical protein
MVSEYDVTRQLELQQQRMETLLVTLLTSCEALTGKTAGRNVDDAVITAERR